MAFSISLSSSNAGKFIWRWILKDCIEVKERKRKSLSCVFFPRDKSEIRHFHVVVIVTAKKCTKKAWCTCKVVVLLFSLPSPWSLLKLPINACLDFASPLLSAANFRTFYISFEFPHSPAHLCDKEKGYIVVIRLITLHDDTVWQPR